MLIEQRLKLLNGEIGFIHQHVVMSRTRGSLDSHVRAEIKVVLPRMSHIVLHQCAWHRVTVLVPSQARRREKADVVALLSDDNCHLRLLIRLANVTRSSQTRYIPCYQDLAGPSHP